MDWLTVLNAHGPYLSDSDDKEILARVISGQDVAEFALRTCLCRARLDGFDAYHAHLAEALREATATSDAP